MPGSGSLRGGQPALGPEPAGEQRATVWQEGVVPGRSQGQRGRGEAGAAGPPPTLESGGACGATDAPRLTPALTSRGCLPEASNGFLENLTPSPRSCPCSVLRGPDAPQLPHPEASGRAERAPPGTRVCGVRPSGLGSLSESERRGLSRGVPTLSRLPRRPLPGRESPSRGSGTQLRLRGRPGPPVPGTGLLALLAPFPVRQVRVLQTHGAT